MARISFLSGTQTPFFSYFRESLFFPNLELNARLFFFRVPPVALFSPSPAALHLPFFFQMLPGSAASAMPPGQFSARLPAVHRTSLPPLNQQSCFSLIKFFPFRRIYFLPDRLPLLSCGLSLPLWKDLTSPFSSKISFSFLFNELRIAGFFFFLTPSPDLFFFPVRD